MSDMLEQAIIDAEALRDAAMKNAETLVLEKFSGQIKDAVEILLEQEEALDLDPTAMATEDPAALGDDPTAVEMPDEPSAPTSSVMEHIPLAATKTDEEQVEIPLDALMEQIKQMSEEMTWDGDEVSDPSLEEGCPDEDVVTEDSDEEVDLDEVFLKELAEEITVHNAKTQKSGYIGATVEEVELAEDELLALEQDSKVREANDEKRKAVKKLNAVNETLIKENKKLEESLAKAKEFIFELRDSVLILKEKLDSTSLSNAKLLYQNKTMCSDSLNERQKRKLVEAISNSESIEEAKVIFETLQSTVGSTLNKKQPKSLGEAVEKPSSMILSNRRNPDRQKANPVYNRWKSLAGIDNNK